MVIQYRIVYSIQTVVAKDSQKDSRNLEVKEPDKPSIFFLSLKTMESCGSCHVKKRIHICVLFFFLERI